MGSLKVIVGGQFGSEAKGHVAAQLAARAHAPVHAARVAGPNAGHTVIGTKGVEADCCEPLSVEAGGGEGLYAWKLRQVPVAAVTDPDAALYIAAGSEIDQTVLEAEVRALDDAGYSVTDRLIVDPSATLIEQQHIEHERRLQMHEKIGSTAKGIGSARADRIMRRARTVSELTHGNYWGTVEVNDVADALHAALAVGSEVHIEGTQGYGLGLHTRHYPQCTSSDTRAVDFLAMAGVSPWYDYVDELEIWVVFRTRPIRVAGNSGELTGETSWAELGLPEERTTVTKKVRRVGTWDPELARAAIRANGGPSPVVKVALTMADQVIPELAGRTGTLDLNVPWATWGEGAGEGPGADADIDTWVRTAALVRNIERDLQGTPVDLIGTGPYTVMDVTR